MVSLGVWGNVGFTILYWIDEILSLNKSRWKNQWVLSRIKIISSDSLNVSLPFSFVSLVSLIISPGIVSLVIGRDCGLSIVEWNPFLFLLSKSGGSWGESSSIICNPIDVIGSSDISLFTPGHLIGLVVLTISP